MNQKGFALSLILILATLIIIGGLYYTKNQKSVVPPNLSDDQMAGWKTYTNEEYDYQFKFPPNLQVFQYQNDRMEVVPQKGDYSSFGVRIENKTLQDIEKEADTTIANGFRQTKTSIFVDSAVFYTPQILSTFKFTK